VSLKRRGFDSTDTVTLHAAGCCATAESKSQFEHPPFGVREYPHRILLVLRQERPFDLHLRTLHVLVDNQIGERAGGLVTPDRRLQ
jgi:hypothetical protein